MPFVKKTVYSEPSHDYIAYAADARGRSINAIADMERVIDEYICTHFCSTIEKREELMDVVMSTKHITYQAKIDILRHLLEKREDVTKAQATKIHDRLTKEIGKQRNIIAHCPIDTSRSSIKKFEADKNTIYLIRHYNGKSVIPFGRKEVIEILELTQSIKAFFISVKAGKHKD